jgi:nucleoside-diphosphate-sugar epimerase
MGPPMRRWGDEVIEDKKIVLTGGAGFIGTTLTRLLADRNQITIYDNLRRNAIGPTSLLDHPNVTFIEGDVLDVDAVATAVRGTQLCVHLAAIAGIDTVIKSPTSTMRVNVIGTFNVLEGLKESLDTVERFVDFSTSEVFGSMAFRSEETHVTSLQPVGEGRWTYAVSKIAGEHMAHAYHDEFGLPTVSIRPFNIYGPGQIGEGAIHVFVKRAIAGDDVLIHGDGDQIRSWCYVEDMIQGIMLCLERPEAVGQVFNIGNPRGTVTIRSLAEKIVQLSGSSSVIRHVPKDYVDVELRIPSIEKAQQVLGYQPRVDLDEGLRRTIAWYRDRAGAAAKSDATTRTDAAAGGGVTGRP